MFLPSSTLPPVQFDSNPSEYHKLGTEFPRGDKRRTMSRSELEKFAKCPRKWLRGIPDESNPAMSWGSLVDCLMLTPDRMEALYAITPEKYETTRMVCPQCGSATDAKKCRECKCDRVEQTVELEWSPKSTHCIEWAEAQKKEGKTIVSPERISDAWRAVKRMQEDPEIVEIMQESKTQVQVCVDWHDEATGLVIPFKCLMDIVPFPESHFGDTLYDLKCSNNAEPKAWNRQVYNYGLFVQAALYIDALNGAKDLKYRNFGHVISESDDPYEPVVRPLSVEWIEEGRFKYQWDLKQYCKCLATGKFPGYSNEPVSPEIWMMSEKS